ncbi:MAG: hypothetical protein M0R28_20905 [Pigmentiphaga sp.]|nr:hypothetical protein [Pigmentiphaga sp.]
MSEEFQSGHESYDGTSSTRRPGALSLDYLISWSIGPNDLSDTSMGLLHRVWRIRVDNLLGKVYVQRSKEPIGAPQDGWEPEFELFSFTISEIYEIDLAFDQNGGAVVVAERPGNQLWLYWFSPVAGNYVFEEIGEGRTPRLLLDDPQSLGESEILLFYINDFAGFPQWRTQAELFATPHDLPLDRWADVETGELVVVGDSTDLYIEEVAKAVDYRLHVFASQKDIAGNYKLIVIETVPYPYRPRSEVLVEGELGFAETVTYILAQDDHEGFLDIGGLLLQAITMDLFMRIATEFDSAPGWAGLIDPENVEPAGTLQAASAEDLVITYPAYDIEALDIAGLLIEAETIVYVIVAPPQDIPSIEPAGLLEQVSTVTV